MREEPSSDTGGLNPHYQNYERQKCFIGLSLGASWRPDIVKVCEDVLLSPPFELEPWYADTYNDPTRSYLQDIVVEMIKNARYGIYDLSYWRKDDNWREDNKSECVMPRNVFIEMGIAIGLNRPMLLLQHEKSRRYGPKLPECLEGIRDQILPFKGPDSLKDALMEHLPDWVNVPPDQQWRNRFCHFGGQTCFYRERHPRSTHWMQGVLPCHAAHGQDDEKSEFRMVIENVLHDYNDVKVSYLNNLPISENYKFLLCSYCQTVRSTPFAIYHITPDTTGETFIAIGISIALEKIFNHKIPKILLTTDMRHVPSLLTGYKVAVAKNYTEAKKPLQEFLSEVYRVVRKASWKSRPLPFIEILPRSTPKPSAAADQGTSSEMDGSEAQANQTNASEAQAISQQGNTLFAQQRYEEALLAYEQAALLAPGEAAPLYNKGLALQALKRYDEALAAYEQAIQARSDYAPAYGGQGMVYTARKEYQQAIARFDQALALDATLDWVKAQREEANRFLSGQNSGPQIKVPATWNTPANAMTASASASTPIPGYDATTTIQSSGRNLQEKPSSPPISERVGNLVEGLLPRSRSSLQPAQVFKKLEYAIEDKSKHLGEGRRLAPEVYDIYISFKDHQQLSPIQAILLKDWQDQLVQFARQHRYTLRSMPLLRLHPSASMRPGSIRVETTFIDVQHMDLDRNNAIAATQAITAEQLERIRNQMSQSQPSVSNPNAAGGYPPTLPSTPVPVMPPAWLTIRLPQSPEKVYRIEKPLIKFGRQLDNDIIVEDKRVSRYHAQIKFESNGQFAIYDLGSTNGITVNGTPHLRQHTLRSGDRFIIGSYDFYFERS